ncbi:phage holin family protein [Propionimicrobium sp. PCR01-08-3]|uniref:phage holin family protein n=1 Tax=Propionimicrobium sp. PCR01-08-3 TaxID=3052086 RepID=UPI00255D0705|nr:phage holin family protein [Propionimicrobium sp. PCR01-08-3]WIY82114.1 phage holin family protein [Propionimicrobium sp. PCR01-08-3]
MADRPGIADYIQVLKTTVPTMLSQIKDLAMAELKPAAKHGGIGAGSFIAALVVALTALFLLMLTGGFALSMFFHEIANRNELTALMFGFLTMAVLCLLIVAALALFGKSQVSKVKAPEATIAEAKASIGAVSEAIGRGSADAKNSTGPSDAISITSAARLDESQQPDDWAAA